MTLQVIGIFLLSAGLLLEIARIGQQLRLGVIIAIVGVILYVYGRLAPAKRRDE